MSGSAAPSLRDVVIVGGGTAGWMTAAALSRRLSGLGLSITLIESDAIGTVGVGEATLPHIREFNRAVGIDEREMMRRTAATIKLGIEFCDWGAPGGSYIHPFGAYGEPIGGLPFYQHWLVAHARGRAAPFGEYCLPIVAAKAGRFEPQQASEGLTAYNYAFQFDAGLYAAYLSELAQGSGVVRKEGRIVAVSRHAESGKVDAVQLEDGSSVGGDLFIDCSGFRALLIEQELAAGFDDWSEWLPCNRAWAVPCSNGGDSSPYTRATAREAGWQWRIPLQHRVGNGHVYCDAYMGEQAAVDVLMAHLESEAIAEPRQLRFTTGKRRRFWDRNVVAIGLSGGFLEPLESTSIDLIQTGIETLVELFPHDECEKADRAEYNRVMDREYDRIRDFLMLHYVANGREGQPFWDHMRALEQPDSLREKIEAFRARGLTPDYEEGLFLQQSWLSVFIGQGVLPHAVDPRTATITDEDRHDALDGFHGRIAEAAHAMPEHLEFLARSGAQYRPGTGAS